MPVIEVDNFEDFRNWGEELIIKKDYLLILSEKTFEFNLIPTVSTRPILMVCFKMDKERWKDDTKKVIAWWGKKILRCKEFIWSADKYQTFRFRAEREVE